MTQLDPLINLLSAMAFGQSLFSASLLLAQIRARMFTIPLVVFFIANAVTELPDIYSNFFGSEESFETLLISVLSGSFLLVLPPSYWLYMRALTSDKRHEFRLNDIWHFVPFILGWPAALGLWHLVQLSEAGALAETESLLVILNIAFVLLMFLAFPFVQFTFYLYKVVRRMLTYRDRLKDQFSSTEGRELTWTIWIGGLVSLYWVSEFGVGIATFIWRALTEQSISVGFSEGSASTAIIAFVLVWSLSIFGLRQNKGLSELTSEVAETPDVSETEKYKNSALSEPQLESFADRIEQQMQSGRLFEDPNLTLRGLASEVGILPNYVSQTLNAKIGKTFFDYVNDYRVEAAKKVLHTTQLPAHDVALEVGFNSRSAFYRAFKNTTGMTPKQFRDTQN